MLYFHEYPDFSSLSHVLAQRWLDVVVATPAEQACRFALAGGTTPEPMYRQFDALFASAAPRSIQLLATDERWVADSDPQSNEGLFRHCFSQSAAYWQLISLKNAMANPVAAVADINERLEKQFSLPDSPDPLWSAVILGMGTDGHTASLFPDAPHLLVDDHGSYCIAAQHPQTGQERISLSFSCLLNTQRIWLLITGPEKRRVLEQALATGLTHSLLTDVVSPVGTLLAAAHCDVEVFWCP